MERFLVSVIIPCYNCAPIIIRCLDSIDYPDCEIVVVDDGSQDNSAHIVEEYALSHPNVTLVRKDNGGVSSARNMGIENATGKYLMFVDADDYLKSDGLEKIVSLAEEKKADIVLYKADFINNNHVCIKESLKDYMYSVRETSGKESLLGNDVPDYVVWLGIFRRSIIIRNNLRFKTDLSLHEDDCFMGMFFCHAQNVVVTDLPLYCYVRASFFSSTHNQTIEKQCALIDSGYKAAAYRKEYVEAHHNEALGMERLKYMRWVCPLRMAFEAHMTKKDYRVVLDKFRVLGVYPLDYRWIKVAGFDYAFKPYVIRIINTFMMNHLWIGWPLAKLIYGWHYQCK